MTQEEKNQRHSELMKRLYAGGRKMGFQKGHKINGGKKFEKGNVAWNKDISGYSIHTIESKLKISEANKGKVLSEETKRKIAEKQIGVPRPYGKPPIFYGEDHWNWKGGIDTENRRLRQSEQYKVWRFSVYKRDKYTCQECNNHCTSKDIVAHHKLEWAQYPDERFNVENGITLCRSCHFRIHKLAVPKPPIL